MLLDLTAKLPEVLCPSGPTELGNRQQLGATLRSPVLPTVLLKKKMGQPLDLCVARTWQPQHEARG